MAAVHEVARRFGVCDQTVYRWMRRGLVTRTGRGQVTYDEDTLREYILQSTWGVPKDPKPAPIRVATHDYRQRQFDMIDTEEL